MDKIAISQRRIIGAIANRFKDLIKGTKTTSKMKDTGAMADSVGLLKAKTERTGSQLDNIKNLITQMSTKGNKNAAGAEIGSLYSKVNVKKLDKIINKNVNNIPVGATNLIKKRMGISPELRNRTADAMESMYNAEKGMFSTKPVVFVSKKQSVADAAAEAFSASNRGSSTKRSKYLVPTVIGGTALGIGGGAYYLDNKKKKEGLV